MMNNMGGSIGSNYPMENQVSSIKLSIEALPESRIQEISMDGTETFFRPLTMSENLCKMASKIDFLAEEEHREVEDDEDNGEEAKKPFQNQRWPWEGIRNRLHQALTEMNVLTDVLTISHSKGPPRKEGMPNEGGRYMMFDLARKELPLVRLTMQLPAKKKGLNAAAEILFNGERRLKSANDEISPTQGYHFQLLTLRRYWRIRKVGTKVFGDLSYRSAGSDFSHAGNFEVLKTTDDDYDDEDIPGAISQDQQSLSRSNILPTKQKPALKVIVGTDLRGYAMIRISINRKQSGISPVDSSSCVIDGLVNKTDPEWHKTLTFAQNVLFCKEVFEKLATQAVQLKISSTLTPFIVVGNKITANIFPETEISIQLLTDPESSSSSQPPKPHGHAHLDSSRDIYSLKFAAMVLLLERHKKIFKIPAPHPATAIFGLTAIQRKAPTKPFPTAQMQSVTDGESKSLLERLVEMTKHWELKRRMCEAIDMLSKSIRDPYIQAQWSTVGCPTETTVRIVIMSAGYEACNRTFVDITIGMDVVKVIQKDGRVISLSTDIDSIREYLLSILCLHQISTAHDICVILGWGIKHYSHHFGVTGIRTALGSISTLMALAPSGNSWVSVRCWVARGGEASQNEHIQYEVQTRTVRVDLSNNNGRRRSQYQWPNSEMPAVQDPKWSLLGGEWKEVDWENLYGRHFIAKFESLLIFLRNNR